MTDTEAAAARLAEDGRTMAKRLCCGAQDCFDGRGCDTSKLIADRLSRKLVPDLMVILAERAEHLAHPAPAAVVGEVTDEMIERACEAYHGEYIGEERACWQAAWQAELAAFEKSRRRSAMRSALAASPPVPAAVVPGWRPIETAPKDGTSILVYGPTSWGADVAEWSGPDGYGHPAGWYSGGGDYYIRTQPTFWQPMPSVPLASAPKPGEAK